MSKKEYFGIPSPTSNSKKTKYKNFKFPQKRFNEKKVPIFDSMFQISYNKNISTTSTVDNFMFLYNKESKLKKDYTPLHLAIEMGNFHLVQFLLKLPTINVNSFTSTGLTGLHMAIRSDNLNIVKYLCEDSGIDIEATLTYVSPLIYATLISTPTILKVLIDHGADVNKTFTTDCLNSLMFAIYKNKKEQSWILAESGICPLHTDVKKWNALHYATLYKSTDKLLKKLIEIGCDKNGITREGMTPLHHAVISGSISAVKILVAINADIHITDENGLTALHYAAYQGHWEIVKILLDYGSRPNKKTNSKVTPLHFAAKHDHYLVVKELLKWYVDINALTMQCNTPLHYAACNGNEEMVNILLKNGADLNIPNKDNDLPVHLACLRGTTNVVKLLCANGSNMDCRNKNNMLPLHNAILSSNEDLIKFLLNKYKFSIDIDLYYVVLRSGNINVIKIVIDRTNVTMFKNVELWYKIICFSGSLEIIKLFLNRVQPPESSISSLVGYAIHLGYFDIAKYLLEYVKKWDDILDAEGNTGLYYAINKNDVELVCLLIEKGSNVKHINDSGITLLQLASKNGNREIMNIILKNWIN